MFLKDMTIRNFRNYQEQKISFSNGMNIIYGNNAQGKTNLLESIYVLGLTKSHRSFIDNNLIRKDQDYAQISGNIDVHHIRTKLEIHLGKTVKKLKVDENDIKKVSDYISKLNIIIFYPEDLELMKGSPALRRRYLNMELSQLYSQYFQILNDYNKVLKIRNELLKRKSKQESIDVNYFDIITGFFIEKSILLYRMRRKFIDKINQIAPQIYEHIAEMSDFSIQYKTNVTFSKDDIDTMREEMAEKLRRLDSVEVRLGTTLVGPHRDDLEFYLKDQNLRTYGSQGQQRMAVLALKLSEIELFKTIRDDTPILLLDDVFSELDDFKKNNLLFYINDHIQTIITTTDLKNLDEQIQKHSKLILVQNGKIIDQEEVEENGTE